MFWNIWPKSLNNICNVVYFQSNYTTEPCKFTKIELYHRYFLGILTTHSKFTVILKIFLKIATAVSKNTFFQNNSIDFFSKYLKLNFSFNKNWKHWYKLWSLRYKTNTFSLLHFILPNFLSGNLTRKNSRKIKIKRIKNVWNIIYDTCLPLLYSFFRIFFISAPKIVYCM